MKKLLKIILKSLLIILLILLIVIISVPYLFKNQLLDKVKEEINKNVNAKVEFADFKVGLIKHFPNLSVSLTDLNVTGTDSFSNDTLISFKSFSTALDLLSLIKKDGINVRSVSLIKPRIHAKVMEDEKVNWDIMKESEEETVEEPDTVVSGTPDIKVNLKKFEIVDAEIVYEDLYSKITASLQDLNFELSGNMSADYTELNLSSSIKDIDFIYGGMQYVRNAMLKMSAEIGADMKNMIFTFRDNSILLNDLGIGFDGKVEMPEDNINIDLTFASVDNKFKSLLSMVPAVYLKDFEEIKTSGALTLRGKVNGIYNSADSTMPDISLEIMVDNAMFSYPDLPKSVENINITTNIFIDGTDMDKTTVNLDRFHLDIAGNPVDASLKLRTPISDPDISGSLKTNMDLQSIVDIIPMEDVVLKGIINADLDFGGSMSMYEKELYDEIKADGTVSLKDFEFKSPDLPQKVIISKAGMEFSPEYVELSELSMILGKSDINIKGKVENFIPFVFEDQTLKGSLDLYSANLDINELMPETEEVVKDDETDSVALSVIKVPENIDFEFTSKLDHIEYGNLDIDNTSGKIVVRDGKVVLDGLQMGLLQGSMRMNGEYNTTDMTKPGVEFDMDVTDIDIPSAFNAFNTVKKLIPLAEGLNGNVSTKLSYNSLLGEDLMPVIETINGYGRLQSENIQVVNSVTLDKISSALKLKKDMSNTFKDLNISFKIIDGRIYVEPFKINLGNIDMVIGGDQGIDQTLNYLVKMSVPRASFGAGANQVIDDLAAKASAKGLKIEPGEKVNVDVKVTGTFTDPKIALDMKSSSENAIKAVKKQVEEKIKKEVEKKKEEVKQKIDEEKEKAKEKLNAEADRILAEAEKRAQQVKDAAAKAAEALRGESKLRAKQLEKEAAGKGMLAKIAAQKAAEKIRTEGDKKADKLVKEADDKAEKIMNEAREKVEALKDK
ncbi:MAG: AsmA family protein [Bacteroidetes bacterium]|nr:AsmA family protein [Bacteroidota bacterium]